MIIQTKRLILRPWQDSDAENLYKYAKDPDIGPIAGWPAHTSIKDSLEVIHNVFSAPETYAVTLKDDGNAIGCAGIMFDNNVPSANSQAEIGYWLGKPFWGRGIIPEAVTVLIKRCFEDLNCQSVWCCYSDGNEKSKRVQEKCGFLYHHTEKDKPCSMMNDIRTEHFNYIPKDLWQLCRAVRKAEPKDLSELLEIYNYEVEYGISTFDLHKKTLDERKSWFKAHTQSLYPILVLEQDGHVAGYSSLSPYREKEAYKSTVELSVYIHPKYRGRGIASALLCEILSYARYNKNIHTVISVITSGNIASQKLHEKFGFDFCGTIKEVGFKFGKYLDIDNYSLKV